MEAVESPARRHGYFPIVRGCLRGLQVLEAVNGLRCAGLRSLVAQTGLPRATVLRLLETLESAGYVLRDPVTRTYMPTPRVSALSLGFDSDGWLVAATTPILRRLLQAIGWPSDVLTLRGDVTVVRNSNRTDCALDINAAFVGMNSPVAGGAGGRAYLAWCSEAERERLLGLVANVKERRAVLREIEATRDRGYAVRDRTLRPQVGAIAIPVLAPAGQLLCCLDCVFLLQVAGEAEVARRCLPAMRAAAAEIAAAFEPFLSRSGVAGDEAQARRLASSRSTMSGAWPT